MALLDRLPPTSPHAMRMLAVGAVVVQAGIAVTGSVVRVTGSGLGCPTWPQCFPGSLVPVPHPETQALTQWIEFSNRMLTFLVVIVAGACLVAALATRPRRTRLTRLALVQPLGVVAQAVIGGMTVLLQLAWWSVAVHFIVSMALVWLAVQLLAEASRGAGQRADADGRADGGGPAEHDGRAGAARRTDGDGRADAGDRAADGGRANADGWANAGARHPSVPRAVRGLAATSSAVLAALLVAGTFVTAAGPHAGDARTPRLDLPVPALAQLHADLLYLYLGMLVALGFTLRAIDAPAPLRRRYRWLVTAVVAQAALGLTQYALGVPDALVSMHVLGAALVTVGAAALWAGTTEPPHGATPQPDPAELASITA